MAPRLAESPKVGLGPNFSKLVELLMVRTAKGRCYCSGGGDGACHFSMLHHQNTRLPLLFALPIYRPRLQQHGLRAAGREVHNADANVA